MANPIPAVEKFLDLLRASVADETFAKLTLSQPTGGDPSLKKALIRPVILREQVHFSFVFRHATRDITKNFLPHEGLARIEQMLGSEFQHAHLFTTAKSAQLKLSEKRQPKLILGKPSGTEAPSMAHDRAKQHLIESDRPWLRELGVTSHDGTVARGMEAKFRQINKFVEVLAALFTDARLAPNPTAPCFLVDMGCGKGYLTFAAYEWLRRLAGEAATVLGIEARDNLVEACNRVAAKNGFSQLQFHRLDIASLELERVDVLVALHACDTATDDAIAKGIKADAKLILVSPCCHKELRPQLTPPPVLAGALRHGIVLERHAEFVTDALRAALLEWAGYDTKVFEFISTEHTAKNLMIAAVKRSDFRPGDVAAEKVRELAAHYGIRTQRLAANLAFDLGNPR